MYRLWWIELEMEVCKVDSVAHSIAEVNVKQNELDRDEMQEVVVRGWTEFYTNCQKTELGGQG